MGQKSVMSLMVNGYRVLAVRLTQTILVDGLRVIKTVWEMGGRTPGIYTGNGVRKVVNYLVLMRRSFLK
ncbi:hypothetical protein M8C21_009289 [Ambrosia artemisiifolia]|uniref:Uncharacterized protein n=1 Tax=Ambrosia artemisiifolia TaxID=4212 RepID=A0AAD5GNB4_AMBAR|nr:hypothetical protein M8C21_009289 [Ambrosia artemisiifolia]